jgi:hypothetical protein
MAPAHGDGGWSMLRGILYLLLAIGIGLVVYHVYEDHQEKAKLDSGDVTCTGPGCLTPDQEKRFEQENSGETADGNREHKDMSAQEAALEAEQGSGSTTTNDGAGTMTPPSATSGSVPNQQSSLPPGLPTQDSEAPNAPNGMRFAGSGIYQWYRQGNLTYRIDTTTGRSCIIYATMEEWRKPIVMSHGCGRTA